MESLDLLYFAEKTPHDSIPVIHTIKSKCSYYHYLCDGVDDRVSPLFWIARGMRPCLVSLTNRVGDVGIEAFSLCVLGL